MRNYFWSTSIAMPWFVSAHGCHDKFCTSGAGTNHICLVVGQIVEIIYSHHRPLARFVLRQSHDGDAENVRGKCSGNNDDMFALRYTLLQWFNWSRRIEVYWSNQGLIVYRQMGRAGALKCAPQPPKHHLLGVLCRVSFKMHSWLAEKDVIIL